MPAGQALLIQSPPLKPNKRGEHKKPTEERRWSRRFITFIAANQKQMTSLLFLRAAGRKEETIENNSNGFALALSLLLYNPLSTTSTSSSSTHPASGYYVSSSSSPRRMHPLHMTFYDVSMSSPSPLYIPHHRCL
jgi:hypothetical protein